MTDGEHVVADIWRRIGDENTREVGEWLHQVSEEHSISTDDDHVIPPSVPWLAEAVSHYIASIALEQEVLGELESDNLEVKVDAEGFGKIRIDNQWRAVVPFDQLNQNQLLRINVGSGDLGIFPRDWEKDGE